MTSTLAAAIALFAPTEAIATVDALLAQDTRVATLGHRLATLAAPLCRPIGWQAGFDVQTLAQYGADYRAAAAVRGVADQPTVMSVVPAGPAERSGMQQGDRVLAVGDRQLGPTRPAGANGDHSGTAAALRLIDAGLANGSLNLTISNEGGEVRTVTIRPQAGCRARFAVTPRHKLNASSDGYEVQVASRLMDFVANDAELATILAHELAHNILDHRNSPRRQSRGSSRDREYAADRLSIYILALANVPAIDVLAFWQRFGRATDLGIWSDRSHPGWRKRIAVVRAEFERVESLRTQGLPILPPPDLLRINPPA